MTEIRTNRAKHNLADGGVVTIVTAPQSPDVIEYFGQFGFDGAWIETEHGPVDFKDIPDMTRACDIWGITSVVRVNQNVEGDIYRTLDVGAQAVVVPHVNTAEEARRVVHAAKFYPLGLRGNFTGRQGIGVQDYANKANDETMVIVLIEDVIALENLDEILEVDEIDVFFVATGDLAQTMGLLGRQQHPDVVAAAAKAHRQINDAGRASGAVVADSDPLGFIDQGARFLVTHWQPWVQERSMAYLAKVAAAFSP